MPELFAPVDIAGLQLSSPLMNGGGPVKLPEHVHAVAMSMAGGVLVGSITLAPREGNPGITYHIGPGRRYSLNARGLPNPGLAYYQQQLPDMVRVAHDNGKPLIVSIAGFSPSEYAQLAGVVAKYVDAVEANLGCPNVWGDTGQKPIASFDADLTGEILERMQQEVGGAWVGIKLSPFSDPLALEKIASVIGNSTLVKAVVTTNTYPNAFGYSEGNTTALDPAGGLGSMGGDAMRPIGLGQVYQLRRLLPERIAIVGVGGISKRRHVEEYLQAGAVAVQVTTAFIEHGPDIFRRLQKK